MSHATGVGVLAHKSSGARVMPPGPQILEEFQVIIVSHPGGATVDSGGGQVVASGPCDCINRDAANTVEFGLSGAEFVLKVNGVPVARVADTQGLSGSGYGVFWVGGPPDSLTSIDLAYFAAK
jgi:hypothetical protein